MKKPIGILLTIFFTSVFFINCGNEAAEHDHVAAEAPAPEETTPTEDLSKYERIRASFTDFSFGDLPHYTFKTEDGAQEMDFNQNKDERVMLEIDDDNAPQGIGINPAMKDKLFDVYYKNEKVTPNGWDEADAMDGKIIYKLMEVKG